MKKFITLTRVNSYGETSDVIIKVDNIVAVKEVHQETEKLYDENGNLVQENPKPKQYIVFVEGCHDLFYITSDSYQTLVKEIE